MIPTVSNHSRMPQICWKGCTFDENHSLIERGFVPRGAVNVWICGTLSVGICETVSWHLAAGVLTQKVNRDSASRWQGAEVRSQLLKPYLRPNPPSSYPPMISSNSSLWAGHTREKNEEAEILFGGPNYIWRLTCLISVKFVRQNVQKYWEHRKINESTSITKGKLGTAGFEGKGKL